MQRMPDLVVCEGHAIDEIARQAPVDGQDHLFRAGGHGNTQARRLVGQFDVDDALHLVVGHTRSPIAGGQPAVGRDDWTSPPPVYIGADSTNQVARPVALRPDWNSLEHDPIKAESGSWSGSCVS